jgi:hypothetical protein
MQRDGAQIGGNPLQLLEIGRRLAEKEVKVHSGDRRAFAAPLPRCRLRLPPT